MIRCWHHAILLVLALQFTCAIAQLPVIQIASTSSIPLLNQQQIDAINAPSEGFVALNSDDGCYHYYVRSTWYRLCGECLPLTADYTIQSVKVSGNLVAIHFQTAETDTLCAWINGQEGMVASQNSPLLIRIANQLDTFVITTAVSNKCHKLQRQKTHRVVADKERLGSLQTVSFGKREVRARKLGSVLWACEDLVPPAADAKQQLVRFEKAICPTGWRLPTQQDFECYLRLVEELPQEVFMEPDNSNSSLGFRRLGAYDEAAKALLHEGNLGSYWLADVKPAGVKKNIINLNENGAMFMTYDASQVRINCRCVRDEP